MAISDSVIVTRADSSAVRKSTPEPIGRAPLSGSVGELRPGPFGRPPAARGAVAAREAAAGKVVVGEELAGKVVAGEEAAGEVMAGEEVAGRAVAREKAAGKEVAGKEVAGEKMGGAASVAGAFGGPDPQPAMDPPISATISKAALRIPSIKARRSGSATPDPRTLGRKNVTDQRLSSIDVDIPTFWNVRSRDVRNPGGAPSRHPDPDSQAATSASIGRTSPANSSGRSICGI
ncbi:hypothetical protein Are01nite_81710 [Actinoplanes regularis]|nr:hypothetical protein Are01nite_81710 [Actinoplanes regularis]